MSKQSDPQFALIVGGARSGTTLLRLLLDAHPEVGCPAEAGLPGLMSHMATVWGTIDADLAMSSEGKDPDPGDAPVPADKAGGDTQDPKPDKPGRRRAPELPEAAKEWIRSASSSAMRRYCDRGGKRLYVDKSLDSVYHLELVQSVFPELRCLLAVRHVMDTIASGIEASPWGFQGYGYGPYVSATPGNFVAALANYWLDHVKAALEWEEAHKDECLRVRYEDLVVNPQDVVSGVQTFLGVSADLSVLSRAFERDALFGPGDYKVEHTTGVHSTSVGHGKRIPVGMLPPALLTAVNEQLEALGYPILDNSWNTAERATAVSAPAIWARQLDALMSSSSAQPGAETAGEIRSFAVVAEDDPTLRWVIDLDAGFLIQGDGEVEAVITGTAEDLVLMLKHEENLGVLLRSGRIRHLLAEGEEKRPNTGRELRSIIASLRSVIAPDCTAAEPDMLTL